MKRIVFTVVQNGFDGRTLSAAVFASYEEKERDEWYAQSPNKNFYRCADLIVDEDSDSITAWNKLNAVEKMLLLDTGCCLWQKDFDTKRLDEGKTTSEFISEENLPTKEPAAADYLTVADLPADFIVITDGYTRLERYSRNDSDDWDLSVWRNHEFEYDDSVGDATALECFHDSDYVAVMLKKGGAGE